MIEQLIIGGIAFGRNMIGILLRPYETYRRLVERGTLWELLYIGILLAAYFSLAALVKTASFRPYLLTRQFIVLAAGAAGGFGVAVGSLWLGGRLAGGKGKLSALALAWGYTLVPTTLWFLATSLLYLLFPPPRTARPQGVTYSLLYLVFSTALLFWKAILAYLTLRFGLRLDLGRILVAAAVTLPALTGYSFLMYRWGVFKVPFL